MISQTGVTIADAKFYKGLVAYAEWPSSSKPFMIAGVHVSGPKGLSRKLTAPGPVDPPTIRQIAHVLNERLHPSTSPSPTV